MSDPRPGTERPYQTDEEWSRVVFARRTGGAAAFLAPQLRAGMRLLDCGCGPGSITVDLAQAVAPGDAIGIVDGSSTITFRYPTNPLLETWDKLRGLQREYNTGRPSEPLELRVLLRKAGFAPTRASGNLATEAGPPAGSLEETHQHARNDLIRLRGVLGELAVAQGWATRPELEQMATALIAWGEAPDAFYARPVFTAIGWA
jgi:hypothetical protein